MPITASRLAAIAAVAALLLAGCASKPRVRVEKKPGVDLDGYQSFAILPMTEAVPDDDPETVAKSVRMIANVVQTELLLKGFREVPAERADLAVVLVASFLPKVDLAGRGFSPEAPGDWNEAYAGFLSDYSETDSRRRAPLALGIYDSKTKELVWVGFGTIKQRRRDTLNDRVDRAGAALQRMLLPVPPAAPRPAR